MALLKAGWPPIGSNSDSYITKHFACGLQDAQSELADSFFWVLIQFPRTQARPRRAGWGEALTLGQ